MLHRSMPGGLTSAALTRLIRRPSVEFFRSLFSASGSARERKRVVGPSPKMRATMTTIRQFIQTSPMKAMELFTKLLATSDNAIKTRERLFGQLKDELELAAKLEEQHLFPVLRKHKETKELVQEALSDNKQTRKLLAQLERTPKDDEEFLSKVMELKKSFQQHVRDEKKELLPAVLKALSDEEAEAVLANIEDEKAAIEGAKRAEAEERRAEARQDAEQVESVQRAADGMASTVTAMAEGARRTASTTQETLRAGLGTASEIAQRSTDHVVELFSFSGKRTQDAAAQAAEGLQAVAQSSTALVRGFQEVSRACLAMTQNRLQMNVEALTAISRCRSLPEFLAAQTALVRGNIELTLENSQRLTQLSMTVVREATGNVCRKSGPSEASRVGLITKRPSSLLGRFAHETTGRRAARDDVCLLDEAFA